MSNQAPLPDLVPCLTLRRFPDVVTESRLTTVRQIGRGSYGFVFHAKDVQRSDLAVKVFIMDEYERMHLTRDIRKYHIPRHQHPNVIQYHAFWFKELADVQEDRLRQLMEVLQIPGTQNFLFGITMDLCDGNLMHHLCCDVRSHSRLVIIRIRDGTRRVRKEFQC